MLLRTLRDKSILPSFKPQKASFDRFFKATNRIWSCPFLTMLFCSIRLHQSINNTRRMIIPIQFKVEMVVWRVPGNHPARKVLGTWTFTEAPGNRHLTTGPMWRRWREMGWPLQSARALQMCNQCWNMACFHTEAASLKRSQKIVILYFEGWCTPSGLLLEVQLIVSLQLVKMTLFDATKRVNEWMSEWVNEWMSEWENEWMSKLF